MLEFDERKDTVSCSMMFKFGFGWILGFGFGLGHISRTLFLSELDNIDIDGVLGHIIEPPGKWHARLWLLV